MGKKRTPRRPRSSPIVNAVKWGLAALLVGGLGYVLLQNAGVAYDEEDIAVVSFADLTTAQRRSALQAANRARCSCGCGMGLAQCVATDMTCPIRDRNIDTIRTMVREARDEP